MSNMYHLYKLQQADTKIAVLEHRLTTLAPSEEHAKTVRVRERKVKEATEALHHLKVKLKESEHNLATVEDHRKQIEKKLYDGKTTSTKELAGFQAEADQMRAQQGKHEEQVLEVMDQVSQQEQEVANLADRLQRGRKALEDEAKKLEQERHDLEAQVAELRQKRIAMAAEIEPPMLSRYDLLRQRKKGVAVARLQGQACGECGVSLPEPVRRRVEERQVEVCSSCERLLFAEAGH